MASIIPKGQVPAINPYNDVPTHEKPNNNVKIIDFLSIE